MRQSNILALDSYGTRGKIQKFTMEREYGILSLFVTLFAVAADFANNFQRYDTINKETSIFLLVCMTLTSVLILDVPMTIAGIALKDYLQGLKPKGETILTVSGACFACLSLGIINLILSVNTGPYMLEDPAMSTSTIFLESNESSGAVIIGAIVLGVLPILTSIASFVCGLWCTNTLLHNVNIDKKALNQLYSARAEVRQAQAEVLARDPRVYVIAEKFEMLKKALENTQNISLEKKEEYWDVMSDLISEIQKAYAESYLNKRTLDKFKEKCNVVRAQEGIREAATLEALATLLNTPDDASAIAEESIKSSQKYNMNNEPGQNCMQYKEMILKED